MPAGVYLHIPFCKSRCSYCDFATDIYRGGETVERYIGALCNEIEVFPSGVQPPSAPTTPSLRSHHPGLAEPRPPLRGQEGSFGHPSAGRRGVGGSDPLVVETIYFGGGTPSLLKPDQVERILSTFHKKFSVESDAEITLEMNPATVTAETLAGYRSLGVNRASFGVQTFNDRHLKLLARGHNAQDARNTFKMLREAGFENISFDLIIGLPGQTLDDWERNLDEALKMEPEHLSLYLLEIHEGTPLAEQIRSGRRPMPDEDLAAAMYELMQERVGGAGYAQYEISNFAKLGFESRHNTKYWRLAPVYGFGVSAHSFDGYQRYSNERDTAEYIRRIEEFGVAEVARERIDAASEYIFLGLRMTEGIDPAEYMRRFHADLEARYASDLERLEHLGLVETAAGRLRLTRRGMLFSNEVFKAFI